MKASATILLTLILLFLHIDAHAQQCGSGYYNAVVTNPGEQPSVINCVSIPGYGQPQSPLPLQWQSRWGAIATDANKSVVGSAIGKITSNQAQNGALDDCRAKGGTQCEVQLPFQNGCASLIVSDTIFFVSARDTKENAEREGVVSCQRKAMNCRAYFTTCSPPVRVQ